MRFTRAVLFGIFLGAFVFFVPFVLPVLFFFIFFGVLLRLFFFASWRRRRWNYGYHRYGYNDTLPIDGGYFRGRPDAKAPVHNIPVQ